MADEKRGSCLCGQVTFSVHGPVRGVGRCHCSLCRKASGTNGNAVFLVRKERFEWRSGEQSTRLYQRASGWSVLRCDECGSPLPQSHDGKHVWVIAGLMDDDLETDIQLHIFCGSRADWDHENPEAPEFDEYPPERKV